MTLQQRSYILGSQVHKLYLYIEEDKVWFKSKEVALVLQYSDTKKAVCNNVEKDCRQTWKCLTSDKNISTPSNWQPKTIFINEAGLYQLMLRSRKPEAIAFRRWVTMDILPELMRESFNKYISIGRQQFDISDDSGGYIYVAATPSSLKESIYKIGTTKNIANRLTTLHTSTHEMYSFHQIIYFKRNGHRAEQMLHKQHYIREFFYLSQYDLLFKIPQFCNQLKIKWQI